MAVRRKYKSPPRYRDGGAVPAAEVVTDHPLGTEAKTESATAAAIDVPQDMPNPLIDALQASLQAEALQREVSRLQREHLPERTAPAPATDVERYVDSLPGLSDHKRDFLKAHPEMLQPGRSQTMARHYADAIRQGIGDDTPEIDRYIVAAVQREQEQQAQPMQPPPVAPAPAAPRRPSIPMSAPVSRDVPTMAGGRVSQNGVHLSPTEREIARLSYRDLPPAEAELEYARQKLKLRSMRADGRYPEPDRN